MQIELNNTNCIEITNEVFAIMAAALCDENEQENEIAEMKVAEKKYNAVCKKEGWKSEAAITAHYEFVALKMTYREKYGERALGAYICGKPCNFKNHNSKGYAKFGQ